jgi:adenine/guanine phosphoribosyltransferase-like PRPP-binding protein
MGDEQSASIENSVEEPEVVDGVLVIANVREVEVARHGPPPFVQVAAVAATGFVAGAATAAVLGRHFARVQARRAPSVAPSAPVRRREPALEVVASRTFVVDVHTLAGP